jgi:mannose-1-phosphate guanylyltransferase
VGGGGTRLRPLTYAVPKPLIPVLNRPLITHLLANLRQHGVSRAVLAASADDRRIETTLGNGSAYGLRLDYCYEQEPLGSGLAVKQAAEGFAEAFFVCNGDVITNLDLTAMAQRHRDNHATLTISLASVEDPSSYGVAQLDHNDRLVRFVEKPPRSEAPSSWANAGTWIFEPELLDHIPDERMDRSLEQLVFPSLIADGFVVQGFPSDAYWMDVGTSDRYLQLHEEILTQQLPGWLPDDIDRTALVGPGSELALGASVSPFVVLGRDCRLETMARVLGPSVIGDSCRIGEKALVERSVLWSDVSLGAGAQVRDSVLGKGCWIGENAVVEGAVLANGVRVRAGVHLARGTRLEPDEVAS